MDYSALRNTLPIDFNSIRDLAAAEPGTPKSRLLMAVPFIGKDVPSHSSEFAHPDALIVIIEILSLNFD